MNAKSSRESRGELTLLGNGPGLFVYHEPVFEGVSGEFDGVPTRTMQKTPSDPIVVAPSALLPEPPAPRRDSIVSARFFEEGERQEALGWKDSPLVDETVVIPVMQFSSFDRVPRRRAPLVLTMATAVVAAIVGFGALGMGAGVAHALLTTRTGKQATEAWQKAKTELSVKLTPPADVTAEAGRAQALAVAPPSPPVGAAVAVPTPAPPADAPVAQDSEPTVIVEPRVAAAPSDATSPVEAPVKQRRHAIAAVARAQHGLVWSPTEQKVTVARPLSSWDQAQHEMQVPATEPSEPAPSAE